MKKNIKTKNKWVQFGAKGRKTLSVLLNSRAPLDEIVFPAAKSFADSPFTIGLGPAKQGEDGHVILTVWAAEFDCAKKEVLPRTKGALNVSITFNRWGGIENVITKCPRGKQEPFSLDVATPEEKTKTITLPHAIGERLGIPLRHIVHFGNQLQSWNLEPQI